jgi:hypothetical protein
MEEEQSHDDFRTDERNCIQSDAKFWKRGRVVGNKIGKFAGSVRLCLEISRLTYAKPTWTPLPYPGVLEYATSPQQQP